MGSIADLNDSALWGAALLTGVPPHQFEVNRAILWRGLDHLGDPGSPPFDVRQDFSGVRGFTPILLSAILVLYYEQHC